MTAGLDAQLAAHINRTLKGIFDETAQYGIGQAGVRQDVVPGYLASVEDDDVLVVARAAVSGRRQVVELGLVVHLVDVHRKIGAAGDGGNIAVVYETFGPETTRPQMPYWELLVRVQWLIVG